MLNTFSVQWSFFVVNCFVFAVCGHDLGFTIL